ncbi:LysR family transcriptional regulator [Paenibacillus xylaniclasticus]|uniref:LysR family transcriptional regulator n=1 Tax=Paenibacillus xylaniclasticus TaxID=588083 RepID=UPI0013DF9DD0|nr:MULTISPECIES: LysR family transcriptional regulator [Paenibacillus]GFN30070.1 LysR family transcriptional regulator [Paenibacillus curdlanolyticus]
MNFDQLQTFIVVCNHGSYHKASGELFLSQPTITHRINQLEEELGAVLLIRSRKELKLTPEGKIFLKHAKTVLDSMANGIVELTSYKNKKINKLNIACTRTYSAYLVPRIMNIFLKHYSDVEVSLHAISTRKAIAGLIEERYHFSFARYSFEHSELEFRLLDQEPVYVVTSHNHPFAQKKRLSIHDVLEEPLIMPTEGSQSREFLQKTINKYPVPYKIRYETDDIELIKHLIMKGAGISFLEGSCVAQEVNNKQLAVHRLEEDPFPLRPTYLVFKQGAEMLQAEPYIKSIIDLWSGDAE